MVPANYGVRCNQRERFRLRTGTLSESVTNIRNAYFCVVGTGLVQAGSTAMQMFSYNFTDLTSFESPIQEVWLEDNELPAFGESTARAMLKKVPTLHLKGLCVGIYDQAGDPVSFVPLDTMQ
jgi:hypothetical protein